VRNLMAVPEARVLAVCDVRPERLALAAAAYPGLQTTSDFQAVLADPRIDAVVIATPVSLHYDLARAVLAAGKHALVEKPLAASVEQAQRLIEAAASRRLTLMVGHTFVYTSAVRKIHELMASDGVGQVYYYDSVRINLGLFQRDVNVIWDLAVHDLSILDYVLAARPRAVAATGMSHIPGEPENIAYLTLFFADNLIAHIHVNWLAPVKVRRTLIGGSRKMILYDDVEPSEKVRVYDKGITLDANPDSVYQMLIGYRSGDMWAPRLDVTEALRTEMGHFVECIHTGATPLTGGAAGLRVVRVLEAATQSIRQQGRLVELAGGHEQ
jgi:predicted dehydrogenase